MDLFNEFLRDLDEPGRYESFRERLDYNTSLSERDYSLLEKKTVELEIQNAELALYFRTLYDLCIERGVFTKSDFREKFNEIDLEDGKKDGMLKRPG